MDKTNSHNLNSADSVKPIGGAGGLTDRPIAALSLDLDNLWAYMRAHGDSGWEAYPSYLESFVPAALDLLEHLGLKITFAIVGQDAAMARHHAVMGMIATQGHEIANHSFHHLPWEYLKSKDAIEAEIGAAEDMIALSAGQKTVGYRGPGFTWTPTLYEVLCNRGYLYDSSVLPTFIGPLARRYYFASSRMNADERRKRKSLYSDFKGGLGANRPYRVEIEAGTLVELPVTTMPVIRTPFHLSYLMYLSQFSRFVAMAYFKMALALCRATGTCLNFLMHPTDLLGQDQVPQLAYFPGMKLPTRTKQRIAADVLGMLKRRFVVVTMKQYALNVPGYIDPPRASPDC